MTAGKLGLGGWVRNCYDGSVEVEAQGERGKVARLISALKQGRAMPMSNEWTSPRSRCRS